ncbi:hypothetical protein SLU01_19370 [Sporosarcina luteola]|uniref:Tail protein n=1 Tax=Sporosarcina luteola TaxID=582850 RepID=A0A511Z858_9BACL|nr:hypothetical protein [Sporosarcina luteola]GEN83625.1 hypothetical protein SLU01_19370 [Sporosarcina luteola]
MRVVVEIDQATVRYVQLRLGEFDKRAPNAISNALNRGMSNINTNVRKEIRKDYHIKAGDINATLSKIRATRGSLSSGVVSKGSLIGLDKFKVSPRTINPNRKTPLTVAVKKSGGSKVPGAFMADISGPKLFMRIKKSRLPIRRLFGPSVPQMLGRKDIRDKIEQDGRDTFERRLQHEISRILDMGRNKR